MPVVSVIVTDEKDVTTLLPWSVEFARARESRLLILQPNQRKGDAQTFDVSFDGNEDGEAKSVANDPVVCAVRAAHASLVEALEFDPGEVAEDETPPPPVTMRLIHDPHPVKGVLRELAASETGLLILRASKSDDRGGAGNLERELVRRAPYETVVMRPTGEGAPRARKVLVPAAGGPHSILAMRLANAVCEKNDGMVTALFVEPAVGVDAEFIGDRILERTIAKSLGVRRERVTKRVVIANKVLHGIQKASESGYDLILAGATHENAVRRMLFRPLSDRILSGGETAVAVIRSAVPLASRVGLAIEEFFRSSVPQMERETRVELVEKIQSNSRWNFDFVALVCLSTLIAAMGLVLNSTAVVIGAMLVAPLMTPLLGTGVALVQSNWVLIGNSTRAVGLGFLLAFVIALLVGFVTGPIEGSEMLARGEPKGLDLAVAFISGMAAAYASCRPNLSAALPGVAIAAALVPPIATAGLSASMPSWVTASGATMLFFTNIVAIVLGAAFTFWSVGLRSVWVSQRGSRWRARVIGALILISAALVFVFGFDVFPKLRERIPDVVRDARAVVEAELEDTQWRWIGAQRVKAGRQDAMTVFRVRIAAAKRPPADLAEKIRTMIRAKKYLDKTEFTVEVVTEIEHVATSP